MVGQTGGSPFLRIALKDPPSPALFESEMLAVDGVSQHGYDKKICPLILGLQEIVWVILDEFREAATCK
jgi:hypothetical protein